MSETMLMLCKLAAPLMEKRPVVTFKQQKTDSHCAIAILWSWISGKFAQSQSTPHAAIIARHQSTSHESMNGVKITLPGHAEHYLTTLLENTT